MKICRLDWEFTQEEAPYALALGLSIRMYPKRKDDSALRISISPYPFQQSIFAFTKSKNRNTLGLARLLRFF